MLLISQRRDHLNQPEVGLGEFRLELLEVVVTFSILMSYFFIDCLIILLEVQ